MHVFYNVLDLAAINAWVLYKKVTKKKIKRKAFILQLATELRKGLINEKETEKQQEENLEEVAESSKKRKKCQVGQCKGNKTLDSCVKCQKRVCGKCVKKTEKKCVKCA